MKHHTEHLVRGPGQRMFWQSWKPARKQARAVVAVVHGFGEHSGRYNNVVASLLPAGFCVYAGGDLGERRRTWRDFCRHRGGKVGVRAEL